jgi:hypothetical protein
VCVYSVCIVQCVGSGLATDSSSYRLCRGLRNCKNRQGTKGCRAVQRDSGYVLTLYKVSSGSSVRIVMSYGLDGRVRFSESEDFCLLHSVQADSGAHLTSYSMDTGASFRGGKRAGYETGH